MHLLLSRTMKGWSRSTGEYGRTCSGVANSMPWSLASMRSAQWFCLAHPHLRQRAASARACASVSPVSTSTKPSMRCPGGSAGMAARCLKCGCAKQNHCALRIEASDHGIEFATPLHVRPYSPVERDHPFIVRDNNKCISCGRCVAACAEIEGVGVLAYQFHAGRLTVGTHNDLPLELTDCVSCGQCVRACPCGALDYVRERGDVFTAINDPKKVVVGFVAPAVRSVI